MAIIKSFEDILESDLQALVDDKVAEGKTIEYKESIDTSDRGKRKFLESVSSFANAIGGDLIFGIRAKEGVATHISGLAGINPDELILGLESLMQNCIKPRIPGMSNRWILLTNSKIVIIFRIKQSWAAPHVVEFQKHWRFFSRNSRGKYPMDIQELRAAFLLSETTIDRIRNFRSHRVNEILENKTPIKLEDGPRIILHVIPLNAFTPGFNYNVSLLYPHRHNLIPKWDADLSVRYNFEGFVVYLVCGPGKSYAYAQFYRNGLVEIVDTSFGTTFKGKKLSIFGMRNE